MIGKHLLADFYDVAPGSLNNDALLSDCLAQAALSCGLTPLGPPALHRFTGGGLTGFLVLSESHIAFHTYPEHGFIALDIFSCGPTDPREALSAFRAALRPGRERMRVENRGTEIGRDGNSAG
ncbi:MAG: adenosylmethionine decarboxylase [Armatimonadetes bacterium]|nr:adenosylmethionine decarboxylase [Armatimonadota bacterium]